MGSTVMPTYLDENGEPIKAKVYLNPETGEPMGAAEEPGLWSGPAGDLSDFARNVARGAWKTTGGALYEAISHPVDTATGLATTAYKIAKPPIYGQPYEGAEVVGGAADALRGEYEKARSSPAGAAEVLGGLGGLVLGPKVPKVVAPLAKFVSPRLYAMGLKVPKFGEGVTRTEVARVALDKNLGVLEGTMTKRMKVIVADAEKAAEKAQTAAVNARTDAAQAASKYGRNSSAAQRAQATADDLAEAATAAKQRAEDAYKRVNDAQSQPGAHYEDNLGVPAADIAGLQDAFKAEQAAAAEAQTAADRAAVKAGRKTAAGERSRVASERAGGKAAVAAQTAEERARIAHIAPLAESGGVMGNVGVRAPAALGGFMLGGFKGAYAAQAALSPTAMRAYGVAAHNLAKMLVADPTRYGITAAQALVMAKNIEEQASAPTPGGLLGQAAESGAGVFAGRTLPVARTIAWTDIHRISQETGVSPKELAEALMAKGFDVAPPAEWRSGNM